MFFYICPRCGDPSYEHLSTHSHCYNCGYSPEYELIDDFDERQYFHLNEMEGDEIS